MPNPSTVFFEGYTITTDKELMQPDAVHRWLSQESYWAKNISFETVQTSIDHSFCIAVLIGDQQIGFARLITDYCVFGYLADVYVEESHRGIGLGKKMMEVLFELEWVTKLRSIKLATKDAHSLYRQYGFMPMANPDIMMEIRRPNVHLTIDSNI